MARLFIEILVNYRWQGKHLLQEFILIPEYFHLLISPTFALERACQLITGGFSFRARKELEFGGENLAKELFAQRVRD
jgi:hypothetical protein